MGEGEKWADARELSSAIMRMYLVTLLGRKGEARIKDISQISGRWQSQSMEADRGTSLGGKIIKYLGRENLAMIKSRKTI